MARKIYRNMHNVDLVTGAYFPVILPDRDRAGQAGRFYKTTDVPPLTVFNSIGAEKKEIPPVPGENADTINGHGEVGEVKPMQAANNNRAPEIIRARVVQYAAAQSQASGKRVRDYFKTIAKRVEATNRRFQSRRLPYRLKVFTDETDNVMIDLAFLDSQEHETTHSVRNVTNENFGRLMDDISTGTGLLIDDLPPR